MAEVNKLIQRHLPNVLTYLHHGLTNAGLEAVNATIQWVKKTARGFRNPDHFKAAIYFHSGGLDLYPHETRWSQFKNYFPPSPLPFAAPARRFAQYSFIRRLTAFRAAALIRFRGRLRRVPDRVSPRWRRVPPAANTVLIAAI
jgi:transposase